VTTATRPAPLSLSAVGLALLCFPLAQPAGAGPNPATYWRVDDVRAGMKGHGRTVMKGTKVETFQAEVLGVLKNTSPGRDLVLCRLSGLNLDKTGVIAGMSGSPVYLENKLLGAVAYAWPFGKEPIAGVTPFCQMHGFVEAFERRDLAEEGKPRRIGLLTPVTIDGQKYDSVTVSQGTDAPVEAAQDGLWLVPLQTPLVATGFTPRSLALLREHLHGTGLVPLQGGGTTGQVAGAEKETPLEIGGPLAVALVQGDFDMSGIGTVTHIEGNRVYGWGHPFLSMGRCDFPLMTGYIHTVYPRQSVSFKMGSPLRTVGVINADVSTCIAGWLERKPDLMPMHVTVARESGDAPRTFNVEVVRCRTLSAPLVAAVLSNAVDMEGDLPEEMTAVLQARIEIDGQAPVVIADTFSGSSYSGSRAPTALFNHVATIVQLLANNSFQPLRINRIDCTTQVLAGRRLAEVEAVELASDTYAPGETLRANVFVRPYKGALERVTVTLPLPADLPEGSYTAQVCDDVTNARYEVRDNPTLSSPRSLEQVLEGLKVQTAARRTNLALRVATPAAGVAVGGQALPNLPPSMVAVMGSTRRTGAQTISTALVARTATDWVISGSESTRFTVTKNKKVQAP
jgi:SpoIVB peptidase S55